MSATVSHPHEAIPKTTKPGSGYRMRSKKELQQEYRSKETMGFAQLRSALHAVDPDTPMRRDIARYQLLIMAANHLMRLETENRVLAQRLSVGVPQIVPEPDVFSPGDDGSIPLPSLMWPTNMDASYYSWTPQACPPVTENAWINVSHAGFGGIACDVMHQLGGSM